MESRSKKSIGMKGVNTASSSPLSRSWSIGPLVRHCLDPAGPCIRAEAVDCVVERNHDRIERLRLRTGSYANWPVVAHAATDNLLPDFPLINKSFELCYACADR